MLLVIRDTMRHNDLENPFADGAGGSLVKNLVETYGTDKDVQYYCVAPFETKFTKSIRSKYQAELLAHIEKVNPDKILAMGVGVHELLCDDGARTTTDARGRLYDYNGVLCITTVSVSNLEMRDSRAMQYVINPSYFRDLVFDFLKLDSNNRVPDEPVIHRKVIASVPELEDELAYIANATAVSLDIETSNNRMKDGKSPSPLHDDIYAIGFGALLSNSPYMSYNIQIPVVLLALRTNEVRRVLKRFFENYNGKIVLHNAMFDMTFLIHWLQYDFLNTDVADTMLMAYTLDERTIAERMGSLSLKYLSKLYFNIPDFSFSWEDFYGLPDDKKDWASLYYYLGIDTHSTISLYHELSKELEDEPELYNVLDNLLNPATVRLAHVILNGMPVDREFLQNQVEVYTAKIESCIDKLYQLDTVQDYQNSTGTAVNFNTPKDIVRLLEVGYGVNVDSSGESVLEDVMHSYAGNEVAELAFLLLEYRSASKLLGTYFLPLLADSEQDGAIHGSFLLHGTSTGRLSSREPNLQNIPKTDNYIVRKAFVAPPGFTFVEVDYSQLELRVMAILSGDETLKAAYVHGEDLHTKTASAIFSVPESEVSKEQRALAKIFNFGIIYGRTGKGIATGKEMQELRREGKKTMSVKEAYEAIDEYFEKYPGIKNYMVRMEKHAHKHHYVESLFGRRRRFPLITNDTKWKIRNQAANMPDQSTAGDFTLWSIVRLYDVLPQQFGTDVRIINTVHDSILFIIKDDVLDEALRVITDVMVNVPIDTKGVPIEVDVDTGKNWGELNEYSLWRNNVP